MAEKWKGPDPVLAALALELVERWLALPEQASLRERLAAQPEAMESPTAAPKPKRRSSKRRRQPRRRR